MYLLLLPEQDQTKVPPVTVPVRLTVTAVPMEELCPTTATVTAAEAVAILAEETLPTGEIEQSAETVEVKPPFDAYDSVRQVRAELAASTNSETLARMV